MLGCDVDLVNGRTSVNRWWVLCGSQSSNGCDESGCQGSSSVHPMYPPNGRALLNHLVHKILTRGPEDPVQVSQLEPSSAAQPTATALWLCVPGLLRVCPFGGTLFGCRYLRGTDRRPSITNTCSYGDSHPKCLTTHPRQLTKPSATHTPPAACGYDNRVFDRCCAYGF
jgi:hypothetical protein